jgi:hypothetical protein
MLSDQSLELASTLAAATGACGGRGSAVGSDGGLRFERDWSAYPAVVTSTGAEEIDVLGDPHEDPDATFRLLARAGLITTTSPIASGSSPQPSWPEPSTQTGTSSQRRRPS